MKKFDNKLCESNNNNIGIMGNESPVSNEKSNKETKKEIFVMDD